MHILNDFGGVLLSSKRYCAFSFKVTTGNYSHTIRIGKSKVVARRSTTANDFIL